MLARGAAAEIVAGDQNLRLAIGRLVEHEIGVLAAVGALDRLQILLGDDHVGVDVDHLQRRSDAFEHGELFHVLSCEERMRVHPWMAKWRVEALGSTLCRRRGRLGSFLGLELRLAVERANLNMVFGVVLVPRQLLRRNMLGIGPPDA